MKVLSALFEDCIIEDGFEDGSEELFEVVCGLFGSSSRFGFAVLFALLVFCGRLLLLEYDVGDIEGGILATLGLRVLRQDAVDDVAGDAAYGIDVSLI